MQEDNNAKQQWENVLFEIDGKRKTSIEQIENISNEEVQEETKPVEKEVEIDKGKTAFSNVMMDI